MDRQEFENIFKNIKEEYIKIVIEKKSIESFVDGERTKIVYGIELKDAEMFEGEVVVKKDGFVFGSFGKYSNFAEYKKPNKEIQKKFLNKLKSKIGSHSEVLNYYETIFNFIKNHKNFNYLEKNKNSIKIKISDKIYFSIEFDQRMSKVLNKKYIIENNDEEIHFEIKNYDRIEKRFFMNVLEELKKEPEYKLKILLNN